MNQAAPYLQNIQQVYPDFPIHSVSFNNAGQNNTILIINGEFIWERIRFYAGSFALLEALFGREHEDQEAFEHGIADYL